MDDQNNMGQSMQPADQTQPVQDMGAPAPAAPMGDASAPMGGMPQEPAAPETPSQDGGMPPADGTPPAPAPMQ